MMRAPALAPGAVKLLAPSTRPSQSPLGRGKLNAFRRAAMAFAPAAILLSLSLSSVAAETNPDPLATSPEPEKVTLVPYPRDNIGGHFQVLAAGTLVVPFGVVSDRVDLQDITDVGGGAQVELAYGLDRYVMVGAYGEFAAFGASVGCSSCQASSLGAGAMVQYHLVQGLKLTPYVSYGIGFRAWNATEVGVESNYAGLEWMRLQLGANWFATKNLGFGPFFAFNGGTMLKTPEGEKTQGSAWQFQLGLKFLLDVPGRRR